MAGKTLRLDVGTRQIKMGKRGDPAGCPIACALKETLAKAGSTIESVWVDGQTIKATVTTTTTHTFKTPKRAVDFIGAFDDGKRVKPTTFILRS